MYLLVFLVYITVFDKKSFGKLCSVFLFIFGLEIIFIYIIKILNLSFGLEKVLGINSKDGTLIKNYMDIFLMFVLVWSTKVLYDKKINRKKFPN